jgi:hypothetical protein
MVMAAVGAGEGGGWVVLNLVDLAMLSDVDRCGLLLILKV